MEPYKVATHGVTYELNGATITEKHFDFKNTIIKQLQIQVDSATATASGDRIGNVKQWLEGVGGAQQLLPMHVVYEYCSDVPFYPVPKFISRPESPMQFYNAWKLVKKNENWLRLL